MSSCCLPRVFIQVVSDPQRNKVARCGPAMRLRTTHTYTNTQAHARTHACAHMCTPAHTYTYTHTGKPTHLRTQTHKHTRVTSCLCVPGPRLHRDVQHLRGHLRLVRLRHRRQSQLGKLCFEDHYAVLRNISDAKECEHTHNNPHSRCTPSPFIDPVAVA